jgi:hypothetical protein
MGDIEYGQASSWGDIEYEKQSSWDKLSKGSTYSRWGTLSRGSRRGGGY